MLTKQDLINQIKNLKGDNCRGRLADYIVANSRASGFYEVNCIINTAYNQLSSAGKTFEQTQEEMANFIWIMLKESDYVDEQTVDKQMKDDNVNHPAHYTSGQFETIDIIKDKLTPEQFEGFCVGNVIKYVTRYKQKNGLEDLEKARWYLDKIISVKGEQK